MSAFMTTSPPTWDAGSPGEKNHRARPVSPSPGPVDMALDSIAASDLEREVVHLVCQVYGARSALRVVDAYRNTRAEQNQIMVRI